MASPTALDKKFVPLALRLINSRGAEAVFHETSGDTFDPGTNERIVGTTVSYTRKVVPPFPFREQLVDGDNIRRSDAQTYVAASGLQFTLSTRLTMTIGGKTWKIEKIEPIYSGELVALYRIHLRS